MLDILAMLALIDGWLDTQVGLLSLLSAYAGCLVILSSWLAFLVGYVDCAV
jgi:hypothetical protein